MKKKITNNVLRVVVSIIGLTTTLNAEAAIFGNGIKTVLAEIKDNYIPVLLICTVVFVLFNLGNFFGADSDWKKGVRNFIIYVIAMAIGSSIIAYAASQSI
jgi:hypothetical protein